MFPGGADLGFYNAPVTKALLIITGATSALNFIIIRNKKYLSHVCNILPYGNVFCGLIRHIYYPNLKTLIFGSLLIYSFRILEHRYGSRKYGNHLIASTVISIGFEYLLMCVSPNEYDLNAMPEGPLGTLFSLFVPFYLTVPSVGYTDLLGFVQVSGKFFTYTIGIQLLLTSRGSLLGGVSGLVGGLFYHYNLCRVQTWLKLPESITNLFSRVFGPFFRSAPGDSQDSIIGATAAIQRQQRMDEVAQQVWQLQEMSSNMAQINNRQDHLDRPAQQNTGQHVSEVQVQRLIEMGFTRQAVLRALAASNNDMGTATNLLLSS